MPSSRLPPQNVHPQTSHHMALGVIEALRNPYAQSTMNQFHNPYSTHYVNAYLQAQQLVHTTPEGYTLSSTYDPRANPHRLPTSGSSHQVPSSMVGQGRRTQALNISRQSTQQNGSWYQPGSSRCTSQSCSFSGSRKAVEIHMMDRHLIYPPDWVKKKKGSDWDADPSLKGKTVPIQGTSIILNTPEALDAWLAERRKRWPTAQRIEEKKKKMEEAVARGQLPLMGNSFRGTKRRREEGQKTRWDNASRHRSSAQTKRRRAFSQNTNESQVHVPRAPSVGLQEVALISAADLGARCPDSSNDDGNDDEAPEVASSKPSINCPLSVEQAALNVSKENAEISVQNGLPSTNIEPVRPRKKEPKLPPRNPFASRPTLLRNLLLPEIRMTVSNLSQAIRFLVDNDFLRDVEFKPGQADRNLIEVLGSG